MISIGLFVEIKLLNNCIILCGIDGFAAQIDMRKQLERHRWGNID